MDAAAVAQGLGDEGLAEQYRRHVLHTAPVAVVDMEAAGAGKCLRATESIKKGSVVLLERAAAWADGDTQNAQGLPEETFALHQTIAQAASVLASPLAMRVTLMHMCPHTRAHLIIRTRGELLRQGATLLAKRLQSGDPTAAEETRKRVCSLVGDAELAADGLEDEVDTRGSARDRLLLCLEMLLAKIQLNSFNLPRPVGMSGSKAGSSTGNTHAFCVFGFAAHMNHSCVPNACHYLDATSPDHPTLVVRAVRDISVGEEVCISYTEVYQPRIGRQEQLRDLYLFDCGCPRCGDERPGAIDSFLDAFKGASLPPPEKVRLFVRLNSQAQEHRDRGEWERALHFFGALVKEAASYLHDDHHWVHFARADIARCLVRLGRPEEAVPHWDVVVDQAHRVYGPAWPTTAGHEHMRILALAAAVAVHETARGGSVGSADPKGSAFDVAAAKARIAELSREYEEHLVVCRGRQCMQCRRHVSVELQCSRCKQAMYCSRECQVVAWKAVHKAECK